MPVFPPGKYNHPKARKVGCPVSIGWAGGHQVPKCPNCGRKMTKAPYK